MLSLLTFYTHGLLNNILHDGRVAALVWGMAAAGGRQLALPTAYFKFPFSLLPEG